MQRHTRLKVVYFLFVVASLLALGGLWWMGTGASADAEMRWFGPQQTISVLAVGQDRRWHFILPGPDGVIGSDDDVRIGAQLGVPANRRVRMRFESRDYVYVFLQPALGINEVAVPGILAEAEFEMPAEGRFEFRSTPLCGFRFHEEDPPQIIVGTPGDPQVRRSG